MKPVKKQCLLSVGCFKLLLIMMPLILVIRILYIAIKKLVNTKKTVVLICIYFFTRLQNATEVDATYLLLPDSVVA